MLVGAPQKPLPGAAFGLFMALRELSRSEIWGIPETQETLDFCGGYGIAADIELIPIQQINEAWERLLHSDGKYRFVIDRASLKQKRCRMELQSCTRS